MTSTSYGLCGVAVICLLFGSILTQQGGSKWLDGRQLDQQGRIAEARIVDRYTRSEPKSLADTYWVKVNFVPEGYARFNLGIQVSEDYMLAHHDPVTSHAKVRYLPHSPWIAVIEGERLFPFKVLFGPPLLILGLVTGFIGLRKLWKEPFWVTEYTGL